MGVRNAVENIVFHLGWLWRVSIMDRGFGIVEIAVAPVSLLPNLPNRISWKAQLLPILGTKDLREFTQFPCSVWICSPGE